MKQAARRFEMSATLIKQWIKSAKVRGHPENPDIINADDLEDAIEQNELFNLTMQVAEREG
jgi:transposase-like protein